ncbi:amidohydrolase [Mesosutterella sp. OilRF-GAM-744-9]|uniref:Amidohydrolase n=1 Tax=Mesosutterella porci TaxID=2915351 RepID=A0ABS9MT50_9BURK|nr:amidohydrolase [Mesosutterella sp. oilRF-744-WT-GAM-9]MCG5031796.1 amidohydrolase [Mesosutterella sp. oilRF-744-WT-GAM-9]MCI6530256.1 amidohydrolase [Mesosutterella sp.]
MLDMIIRNGRIVDWKNNMNQIGNLGIKDGRIVFAGGCDAAAKKEIDARNMLVIPGIIDSHMHASSWLGGPMSFRMLAAAGVTTAMEMAGPVDSVKQYLAAYGTGLNIALLEQLRPFKNISGPAPNEAELKAAVEAALENGAYGVKLLGGHYPMTPESTASLIRLCAENNAFLAIHAGTTQQGSNISGMSQIIELAAGNPFHLAHINAYCRGMVLPLKDELSRAEELLLAHPEIETESYLSPINGCSGRCSSGIPESGVTRNCLIASGYEPTRSGLAAAIRDGIAQVHALRDGQTVLVNETEGIELWKQKNSDVPVSFSVNPGLSRFFFAVGKRPDGRFLVDSFCTDGGGIPRNVILSCGLALVRFKALSLNEFVLKSSYKAACQMGLTSKGHFSPGADADVTVADPARQKAVYTINAGRIIYQNNQFPVSGGVLITTPQGARAPLAPSLGKLVINVRSLLQKRRGAKLSSGL